MIKKLMWILTGLVLLAFLALIIWGDRFPAGSIIAGLAAFIAAIKSKFLGSDKLFEKIEEIQNKYDEKRKIREEEKMKYERSYDSLKMRIEEIDLKVEELGGKMEEAEKEEYRGERRSEEEILRWLGRW